MRQESLFEGFVTSPAGARGLMQVMPATGEEIFNQNGWPPGYTGEDLYRPLVSVTYGAYYLDRQRKSFEGNLNAVLAAYHGGPGNTSVWYPLASDDPDLLVEVIRIGTTRNYIRYIYEIFTIYRKLYEVTP
jgi:soluble lytic murein transglycosylase